MLNKNITIDIPCPECRHLTSIAINTIETNPNYNCPNCNKTIELDARDFSSGLKEAENQLSDFIKNLKF